MRRPLLALAAVLVLAACAAQPDMEHLYGARPYPQLSALPAGPDRDALACVRASSTKTAREITDCYTSRGLAVPDIN